MVLGIAMEIWIVVGLADFGRPFIDKHAGPSVSQSWAA